jgi:uncharacterized protein YcaQ
VERLSAATARRIALGAQGFADPRPAGRIDRRHGRRLFDHVGLVQIDSVNVLVRSQELPVFARLGPHPRDLLPAMLDDHELFEYWGHVASLIPVEHQPLFRWQMAAATAGERMWPGVARLARDRPGYIEAVYEEVKERGPLRASELSDPGPKRKEPWWSWEDGKRALEYLFWTGQLSARRLSNFERAYDLTERILPGHVLALPTPSEADGRRELLALAARALGVATAPDLCDYYRLNIPKSKAALAELVEAGRLVPVEVEGWRRPAYLYRGARRPRHIGARTLLSPFDSLIWERDRTERLFGFRYRIEIYTPAPKRVYGYYVLPFLLGEDLVARVDLKSDRKASALLVPAAWREPGVPEDEVASELMAELRGLAAWLELDRVVIGTRGDLSVALARAARTPSSPSGPASPRTRRTSARSAPATTG